MNILLLLLLGVCTVISNEAIPPHLRECYMNKTIWDSQLPMSLRVIVDIIQKAERHTTMSMRAISTSLLHRYNN